MRLLHLKVCFFGFSLFFLVGAISSPGFAQEAGPHDTGATHGVITILSPKNGAVLKSGSHIKLTYKVHLSPNGNHLHIYVDGQPPIIDRDVSGCPCSTTLPMLSPGKHEVAVKEAMANHVLTGVQSSVNFTIK